MYSGGSDTCLEVRVKGRSYDALQMALDLSVRDHKAVEAWSSQDGWLVFHWGTGTPVDKTVATLPFRVATNSKFVKEFIVQWLENAEYPREPDHDGSNGRGFEFKNTERAGWTYEAFRVRPAWMEYHK